MNEIKKELIRLAQEEYQVILPCTTRRNLDDCFTIEGERVCFWFNTCDHTTHMMIAEH